MLVGTVRPLSAILPLILASFRIFGQSYSMSTAAGGALPVHLPAASANLGWGEPLGVAVDGHGNLFLVDQNAILRIDATSGMVTLFAGNGTPGYSGDNGPATAAQLNLQPAQGSIPQGGVAVDSQGNVYIADSGNSVIRRVTNGVITTVAGGGAATGDGIPATSAQLARPCGVNVDPLGNFYLATGTAVYQVAGGAITHVAGNGSGYGGDGGPATAALLSGACSVAVDAAANLYIADFGNNVVRQVSKGTITTFAGTPQSCGYSGDNGAAGSATLCGPSAVAVDSAGTVYIADETNHAVRQVAGGKISTVAAGFPSPIGLALDGLGNLWVADNQARIVDQVSHGAVSKVAGGGPYLDNGPATGGQLNYPTALALDASGTLYVADTQDSAIRKVSNGSISTVAADSCDPEGVAVDSQGNLYLADFGCAAIRKVDASGTVTTLAGVDPSGAPLQGPEGIAVDSAGRVYFTDYFLGEVNVIDNGVVSAVVQGSGPTSLALDAAGDLYIADFDANLVSRWSHGVLTTVAGTGKAGYAGDGGQATDAELNGPVGVALDPAGNLYIADGNNHAIRKVSNGVIATIAGGGPSFGDGGPALSAQLQFPWAAAVGCDFGVYIADPNDNRIRLASPVAPDLTVAASHAVSFAPGDRGDIYSLTVSNSGTAATAGPVTVADTLPPGLTATAIAGPNGSGWNCTLASLTCTNNTVLGAGASYPAISLTVNVAGNPPGSVTNTAVVSGGGELNTCNDTASDPTAILSHPPSLTITKSHTAVFLGQNGAAYTVVVSNATGAGPAGGAVTVSETVPAGLTLASMSGDGWDCPKGGNKCTRSDALAGGASYAAITVLVNVAANAGPSVTNRVAVSGGGSAAAGASDPTALYAPGACDLTNQGSVTIGDVQSMINQALGATAPANDLNRDGAVTVVDVAMVIRSALGMGCSTS